MNIAIPFYSGSGHTQKLATLIAAGALSGGKVTVSLHDVTSLTSADTDKINASDAIIFGAPTYMGGIAAPFKSFMDDSSDLWQSRGWANKIAAGFTVATFPGGDKLASLQQLSIFAAQHAMIWVGDDQIGAPVTGDAVNPNGHWLGLAASSSRDKSVLIDAPDATTAHHFGIRIATATLRWHTAP